MAHFTVRNRRNPPRRARQLASAYQGFGKALEGPLRPRHCAGHSLLHAEHRQIHRIARRKHNLAANMVELRLHRVEVNPLDSESPRALSLGNECEESLSLGFSRNDLAPGGGAAPSSRAWDAALAAVAVVSE